jgi:hypothetical protein
MIRRLISKVSALGLLAALLVPFAASASPSTVVVTPAHLQGWEIYTTATGQVSFVHDSTSPLPNGALQIDTPATSDESQVYRNVTPTPISSVTNMSYSAKRLAGATYAAPAYVVGIDPDGNTSDTSDEIYAWYEPVYDPSAPTDYSNWQTYTLDTTTTPFWSFDTIDGSGHGGANGANLFTLNDVKAAHPNAKVIDITLNVGSGTPGWSVRADNVTFNDTTWDFQLTNVPTDKNQCKNNGYKNYTDANGDAFSNQGQCVSFVNGRGTRIINRTTNKVHIKNNSTQSANTGNAKVKGNNTGGSATSGNASNSNSTSNTVDITNNPTF